MNTISPGIIITPLANDELSCPRGDGYRRMISISAAGRAGTPDEIATAAALLMGPDGAFHYRKRFADGWRCDGGLLIWKARVALIDLHRRRLVLLMIGNVPSNWNLSRS